MLLFLGCAHLVDISVTGAAIAPTMANGAAWDGPDRLAPEVGGLLSKVVSGLDPQLRQSAAETVAQKAAPDAYGTVTLLTRDERNGETAPLMLASEDSHDPDWSAAPASFAGVKLRTDTRLRVALIDKDVVTDDPIGTVEVSGAELLAALRAEAPWRTDVSAQSSGQLRDLRIVVKKQKR